MGEKGITGDRKRERGREGGTITQRRSRTSAGAWGPTNCVVLPRDVATVVHISRNSFGFLGLRTGCIAERNVVTLVFVTLFSWGLRHLWRMMIPVFVIQRVFFGYFSFHDVQRAYFDRHSFVRMLQMGSLDVVS